MPESTGLLKQTATSDRSSAEPWFLSASKALIRFPNVLPILVLALMVVIRIQGTVDADVSWQLWVASQLRHGARLYGDIVEVNPPLWFWLALPVDGIATFSGVRADAVMIAAVGLATVLSLIATGRLLPTLDERRRSLFLCAAAAVLFGMPWMHPGQREQLALIGALPYSALIAARKEGRQVPGLLAFATGAGAAVGFALKHYFLIVPGLLEMWIIIEQRASWRSLRPEVVGLVMVGILYAVATLFWARDFFTIGLPLVFLAYGATGAPRFVDILQPPIWIALLIMSFILVHARSGLERRAPLATALLIAALGFGAAYFIQHKGWLYHSIPLLGCASLSLAALLFELPEPPPSLRIFGPALLVLPLVMAFQEWRAEKLPTPELVHSVAGLSRGDTVAFISTNTALAWSVTLQEGLNYASRYSSFWMMRAIIRNELEGSPDPRLTSLRHEIVDRTVLDFRCMPPRRIVVERPPAKDNRTHPFDILAFFLEDPGFAALFSHYHQTWRGGTLATYDLSVPLVRLPKSSCPLAGWTASATSNKQG